MRLLGLTAVLGIAACTATPDPHVGSLAGHWSGVVGIVAYDAQVAQQAASLTGTGTIGPTPTSGAEFPTRLATLTGSFRSPAMQLTFRSQNSIIATFSGVLVSADVIRGFIQVDSALAAPLTLYRR